MDYLEYIAILVVDGVILAVCYKHYKKNKDLAKKFANAYEEGVNPSRDTLKVDYGGKKLSVVTGNVKGLEPSIRSVNSYLTTGVIQKLTIRERAFTRNSHGYWREEDSIIDEKCTVIPFQIKSGKYAVKVVAPLEAEYLALDVIEDRFEPSISGVLERLFGLLVGIHHRGTQYTEYLLKEDAPLTGYGELIVNDKDGGLQIQPPTDGTTYVLTTLEPYLFLRKLNENVTFYRWPLVICSCVAILTAALFTVKWWKLRKERERMLTLKRLENEAKLERLIRATNVTSNEVADLENLNCVICYTNPRQIILIPCGHLCLCAQCTKHLGKLCPICRQQVDSVNPAFIS